MTNATRLAVIAAGVWVASVAGLVYGTTTWVLDRWDDAVEMLTDDGGDDD
jgi:hypothetical protein